MLNPCWTHVKPILTDERAGISAGFVWRAPWRAASGSPSEKDANQITKDINEITKDAAMALAVKAYP